MIRAPTGGGVRGGPFHAGSPEGLFAGQPGLKVVCPGTVRDAYGLLRAAIDDPDPVLVLEHKGLYRRLRDEAPPAGSPRRRSVVRASRGAGTDATVVTYGSGVSPALAAVEASASTRRSSTCAPSGRSTATRCSSRSSATSRLLVLQEASRSTGVAGHVLSLVAREGFELLDAPPVLHAPPDTPVPFAPELEDAYLPSTASTVRALEELLAY